MLSKLRQTPWIAGALLLALAVGVAAPLGYALGLHTWPFYTGLAVGALFVMGWLERRWLRQPERLPGRPRSRFRVLPGGKGYDLEEDEPGDKPRWLM